MLGKFSFKMVCFRGCVKLPNKLLFPIVHFVCVPSSKVATAGKWPYGIIHLRMDVYMHVQTRIGKVLIV